jgi:aspartate/methionine/tyrosine aminotransferase
LCRKHGIFHISDEAYEYFVYGGRRHFSPAAIEGAEEHTVALYSLSKAYGFAAWRIGYMVVPRSLLDAVKKIQDTNLICAPLLNQRLAAAALKAGPDYCRPFVQELGRTRERALKRLRPLGDRIRVPEPEGAFYILLGLDAPVDDDLDLVRRLIADHGVAVVPGSAFDVRDPPTLRVSYGALSGADVDRGIDRLVGGLDNILRT